MIMGSLCQLVLLFYLSVVMGNVEKRLALQSLETFVLGKTNKKIPPFSGNDNDTRINVTMQYSPLAILDLDSANEILSVSSYYQIAWRDDALKWNPENFSQHTILELDSTDIWTPKIFLSDSITNLQPLTSKHSVIVVNNGQILWQLSDIFHTRCMIDVRDYPFDIQKCLVTFIPAFGYNLNLHKVHPTTLDNITLGPKNGEWLFEGMNYTLRPVGDTGLYAGQFALTIRRKVLYYSINIIFPMSLLSILNPFVFLIPARSGEKLGFLMAIFVSHAMFLNLIHQSMPPTSDAISTLAMFLALIEVQGFLTILATIAVLCVHHRKEKAKEEREKHGSQKDKRRSQQDVTDQKDQDAQHVMEFVQIKNRGRSFCKDFSLERFLDGIFFFLSLTISVAGCALWLVAL